MTLPAPRPMLPPPGGDARVFSLPMRGGLGDCAPTGRVRLDTIAAWLQDVAFGDVENAGLADAAVWVVRVNRVRVRSFPRFAEPVLVRTWCSGVGRMWAERRTSIQGAAGAEVDAVAVWVHLDPVQRVPCRLTEGELVQYGAGAAGERHVSARLHQPAPERFDDGTVLESAWAFRAGERDLADHVNNAAYWRVLEEELLGREGEEVRALDAEMEFRSPSQAGPARVLRNGPMRWICGVDGEVRASIALHAIS